MLSQVREVLLDERHFHAVQQKFNDSCGKTEWQKNRARAMHSRLKEDARYQP